MKKMISILSFIFTFALPAGAEKTTQGICFECVRKTINDSFSPILQTIKKAQSDLIASSIKKEEKIESLRNQLRSCQKKLASP